MTMPGKDKPWRRARRQLLAWLGLAIPLLSPLRADAAPPAAGLLVVGVVGQGSYGTIKGRLVWGGENVPPPAVLVSAG